MPIHLFWGDDDAARNRAVEALTEGDLTNEFTLGQPVYFRAFMEQSAPKELAKVAPGTSVEDYAFGMAYGMRISVDGKAPFDMKFTQFNTKRNNLQWTTWRGFFVKEASVDISIEQGASVFREFLSRASQKGMLTPGKHALKVELYPFYVGSGNAVTTGEVVASGEVASTVLAPVPWFPFTGARFGAYGRMAAVPRFEERHGLRVHHPRYLVIPKFGMNWAPHLLYAAARPALGRLLAAGVRVQAIDAQIGRASCRERV